MNADLQGLAERLDTDPKDILAIQQLADYLEERGADPSAVRALTIDRPAVLVFGHEPYCSPEFVRELSLMAERVTSWLEEHTGHPVFAVVMPRDITIRAIKTNPAPEAP